MTNLRELAEQVIGGDYYSIDDDGGRASRVAVDWPWSLASTALTSLPNSDEAGLRYLEALCERVERCNWATLWEDPGVYPSGAGASAMPSRYEPAPEVHALADAVREEIEAPATLTSAQVRDEPNTEIRRHMLDRYAGLRGSAAAGRWLTDMGLKPISQEDITGKMQPSGLTIWRLSHGDAPVLCKLYRAELPDDEPMHLLWVVCTSTAKEVFLRVPPTITDAAEARAWTFGGADLAQAVET